MLHRMNSPGPTLIRYNSSPVRLITVLPAPLIQTVRPIITSCPPPSLTRYAIHRSIHDMYHAAVPQPNVSSVSRKRKSVSECKKSDSSDGLSNNQSAESTSKSSDDEESPSKVQVVQVVFSSHTRRLAAVPGSLHELTASAASSSKDIEQVTANIMSYIHEHRQKQELYTQKMHLRDMLYSIVKEIFPHSGLYVVGSSVNGFGSNESDMDMCLMLTNNEISREQSVQILHILKSTLRKCHFLEKLLVINAKVPILKFSDKHLRLSCDLNINNSVGIRNTHLLNAYAKMDCRLVPLVLFIKHWAKAQGINNASQATISSYSFVLMAIHFLQCGCKPAVISCLQTSYPHLFAADTDIRQLNLNESLQTYRSSNQQTVGELFLGFLRYYNQDFDFDMDVASVRLGRKMRRQDIIKSHRGAPTDDWKFICIEEPFNLTNAARSVYDVNNFERIRRVFSQSFIQLRHTGDILSILDHPF